MDANPALKEKVMRIMANEQGSNPRGTQGVLETMMNRALVRGTNLETQARWHGTEPSGYYARGNMGRGAIENPVHKAVLDRAMANVRAGSNITDYATDNSSQGLAARERATGSFLYRTDINGETFFAPATAEPRLAQRWQDWQARTAAAGSARPATSGWLPGSSYRGPAGSSLWDHRIGTSRDALVSNSSNSSVNNTSTSSTHVGELNVHVPPGSDGAAIGHGVKQELQRYDNIQQSNTGLF
jgi:hypothetical protein